VNDLALEIRFLDNVVVEDLERADTCSSQVSKYWRTQTTGAHHGDTGIDDATLAIAVYEIGDGQRRVIDPAPQSFQPLIN